MHPLTNNHKRCSSKNVYGRTEFAAVREPWQIFTVTRLVLRTFTNSSKKELVLGKTAEKTRHNVCVSFRCGLSSKLAHVFVLVWPNTYWSWLRSYKIQPQFASVKLLCMRETLNGSTRFSCGFAAVSFYGKYTRARQKPAAGLRSHTVVCIYIFI